MKSKRLMNGSRFTRVVTGTIIQSIGVIGMVIPLALSSYFAYLYPDFIFNIYVGRYVGFIVFAIPLGVYCWLVTAPIMNFGSALIAPRALEILATDSRSPILYLRSFIEEKRIRKAEMALSEMLGQQGPFLAIGRPGDRLPKLGAARLYLPDDEWQSTVSILLQRSQLVLMATGESPGLHWEVSECLRLLSPLQLIIVVSNNVYALRGFIKNFPPLRNSDELDLFRLPLNAEKTSWRLGRLRPEQDSVGSSINGFLTFDQKWNVTRHPVQYSDEEIRSHKDIEYDRPMAEYEERLSLALDRAVHKLDPNRPMIRLPSHWKAAARFSEVDRFMPRMGPRRS